jgi:hypothetical protein
VWTSWRCYFVYHTSLSLRKKAPSFVYICISPRKGRDPQMMEEMRPNKQIQRRQKLNLRKYTGREDKRILTNEFKPQY